MIDITGHTFRERLLRWDKEKNGRAMPWKGEKDPYKIWLSEIILQQTRVQQGLPYYHKFVEHFPTVNGLAAAPLDRIMVLWQGLGYYSRARNLHAAAKMVVDEFNGEFPAKYEDILRLKGVGDYTAAAIASFAFDIPVPVIDGNVYRVLARIFGVRTPYDTAEGKKLFKKLAQGLLSKERPAAYNQAIMDFGATVCTPARPGCDNCPFSDMCIAYQNDICEKLPVKSKKISKKNRYFNYLILENDDCVWLEKRTKKDIWQDLYQFPAIESNKVLEPGELYKKKEWKKLAPQSRPQAVLVSDIYKQSLTHQNIYARFLTFRDAKDLKGPYVKVKRNSLTNFAFPKIIDCYIKDKTLYLSLL